MNPREYNLLFPVRQKSYESHLWELPELELIKRPTFCTKCYAYIQDDHTD
jgi:hypothetical protein